ncbi:Eco57I restriction-modification methylase domain-containing protein [Thiocapsa sp.]|uniref:Eco57I restriction-modification methylase domain-containing protein n=1 Tax=Thiocapsa sp. TaxID=2024551 RepID=UPI0035948F19
MDKDTRNRIERATQSARAMLEQDFADQLAGVFDIRLDGTLAAEPGGHLDAVQRVLWGKLMAALEHHRASGQKASEAVATYLREAAFTTLNRFVALKMLEARGLVQECVSSGEQSAGFKEFCGLAPGLVQLPDHGYRLYIESLFDELSTEVKVLFDRRDPSSVLWPKRATFDRLLEILNDPGFRVQGSGSGKPILEPQTLNPEPPTIWDQDETIGWVYQFFNGQDERRKMREVSQAPRNSRELAVRNQFFTPRYVVQFLTDNTLGRIWYEMRGTETALDDQCEYMVRRPDETFAPRAKKDPRDLRVLDPACGSGHFLLYAFDLLLAIYEEAYGDPESPRSEATGKTLAEDYPTVDVLRKALPGLVLAHNLHGVDIDPRCAQIAQLALWMRAQRAYRDFGIGRAERPQIRRSNIVVAEPLVAEEQIAKEFVATLDDPELGRVFMSLVESLNLAGNLGLLLKVEDLVARPAACGWTGDLFAPPEQRIRNALARFVGEEQLRVNARRRLFADDTVEALSLLAIAEQAFDVVLMNPPFGEMSRQIQDYADTHYAEGRNDIYAVFVRRASELAARANGRVGALTSRAFVTGRDHRHFRRSLLAGADERLSLLADLGAGVLDGAMVETAAYVLAPPKPGCDSTILFLDGRRCDRNALAAQLQRPPQLAWPSARFLELPQADLVYDLDDESYQSLASGGAAIEPTIGRVTFGLTTKDDFRFVRLRWEIAPTAVGRNGPWTPFAKGGEYSWFTATTHLLVRQGRGADEIAAFAEQRDGNIASTRRSSVYYFNAAVCFSRRSQRGFSARRLRPNACFSDKTAVIIPQVGQEQWLSALAPVLASVEYQRLIAAQSKFGSYEIGPVKALPVPDKRALSQERHWERLYEYFDLLESVDETSETFAGLPSSDWSPAREWPQARAPLIEGLAACGLTADPEVLRQLDAWVDERERRYDAETARRSWAVGVAFGRFDLESKQPAGVPSCCAPDAVPPACKTEPVSSHILVDDYGHPDDIVKRMHVALTDVDGEDLREWLRTKFWDEHLNTYSRSRRTAPIYWRLTIPSGAHSLWLYSFGMSADSLYRAHADYVAPKLTHEERRLEALTMELRDGATAAQRKELVAQQTLVEELRAFLAEVKRVAPLWNPDLDDGVIINLAPLWRLVPQNKAWQKELKTTWDALCEGKYDWAHLAMHLWPERVVPKCAKDRSLAIAHGLEGVFWNEGDSGKWLPCTVAQVEIDRLIAERTSAAVKDALNSLLEAPAPVTGRGGGRKSSGRTPARRASTTPRSVDRGPDFRTAMGSSAPDPAVLGAVRQAIASSQGGISKSEVLVATGLTDPQWNLAINALLTEGTVTKTGAARGTRYHLSVTD